jgi:hypothetical protein
MNGIITSDVVNMGGSLLFEPGVTAGTVQADKAEAQAGVAAWGALNNYPKEIIDLVAKSTEIGALLSWKIAVLHGKRIKAVTVDADGKATEIDNPEINSFLRARTTKRYWREACTDMTWFANVFVELIKSKDKKKIAYIGTQDASFCRLGEMKEGVIKECFVSALWPSAKKSDATTLTYDVLDPYSYLAVEEAQKSKVLKYIYPISIPSPGKLYYQLASWDGLRLSKWIDLMVSIPVLKEAYLNQVLNVVYKVGVNSSLWPQWFKNWDDLTDSEKATKKKEWVDALNKKLCGKEKGGSSLLAEFAYDLDGKLVEGVTIAPIQNPFKDGQWLEDSQEGSAHTMRALGVDATLVGAGPGKNMGAGSGSDKLVAVKIYEALQIFTREILLEPFYFVAEYNGWFQQHPDLEFQVDGIELNFDKATVRPIGQKGVGDATA